jgi:hypothetical protein
MFNSEHCSQKPETYGLWLEVVDSLFEGSSGKLNNKLKLFKLEEVAYGKRKTAGAL